MCDATLFFFISHLYPFSSQPPIWSLLALSNNMKMLLLACLLLASSRTALSFSTEASKTKVVAKALYNGLESTPLTRASDQKSLLLPTLWRANTPLGLADEVSVCAFLRHFG